MGKRWYIWFLLTVIITVWQAPVLHIKAKEKQGEQISVRAVLPENQYNKEKTYFDLMMKPGGKQKIQVEVENKGTEEAEVEAEVRPAYTNDQGGIEYGERTGKNDATLKYDIADFVTIPKRIKVPAGETAYLELEIQMPEEEYEGVAAGGITIQKVSTEPAGEEAETEEKNIAVINEYSYVIGIILRENEKEVKPQLNLRYISTDNAGENSQVRANLQNEKAVFMEEIKIEAQIRKKGEKPILYETKAEDYRMAPNSNFDFLIEPGEKLEAGIYTLYFNAASQNRSWNWKEDFTVKDKEKIEEVVEKKATLWLYILIICIIIVSAAAIGIAAKNKKQAN